MFLPVIQNLTYVTLFSILLSKSIVTGNALFDTLTAPADKVIDKTLPMTYGIATSTLVTAAQGLTTLTGGYPPSAQVKDGDKFDIIIVGGGTAGCILANRLTEVKNWTILLLEAGGDPPSLTSDISGLFQLNAKSSIDWAYPTLNDGVVSQSLNGGSVVIHTAKCLGGASSIGYTTYNRGKRDTYDTWNISGWDYNSVKKYYTKLENYQQAKFDKSSPNAEVHGFDGPIDITTHVGSVFDQPEQDILSAFAELGYNIVDDVNDPEAYGIGRAQILAAKGLRSGTAQKYLLPAAKRPNLFVLKNTLGLRVIFDSNNTARGVEVLRENGDRQSLYADVEVILSAGVYRTPQILMLSGVGPKDHLESLGVNVRLDLPVGTYYRDLPAPFVFSTGQGGIVGVTDIAASLANLGTFPLPVLDGTIKASVEDKPSIKALTLQFGTASAILYLGCTIDFNLQSEVCSRALGNGLDHNIINPFSVLTYPFSKGSITLNNTDPTKYPNIYQGYYNDSRDLDVAIEGIKIISSLSNTSKLKRAGSRPITFPNCDKYQQYSEEYFRCQTLEGTGSLFYGISSCVMGTDGVVDSELRVYGTWRLRVVDASVIPSSRAAEPLSITMMMAEKAADIIKQSHGYL